MCAPTSSYLLVCGCLLLPALLCTGSPVPEDSTRHRSKRAAPTLANRTACNPGDVQPAIRVNTTQRLADMRAAMRALSPKPVDAFIVLSDDAHGSEYPAASDKRRGFISGFSGSAGYAAVTLTKAALWTDGRYFLEAEDALDCNWIFMRAGEKDVPTLTEWLISELNAGDAVGADPFLVPNSLWLSYESALKKANITLDQVAQNPVDTAWGANKPNPPMTDVNALELKYAGKTWQTKVSDIMTDMITKGMFGAYVVTSLDEIAWLFNIRASDIEYNPFLLAYAIIEVSPNSGGNRIRLYMYDKDRRLSMEPSDAETTHKLHEHLNTGVDGQCPQPVQPFCVEVLPYNSIEVIMAVMAVAQASPTNKIWVTHVCNYAIYSVIPEAQRVQERSYIALAKAQKNEVERQGMERCYNRDSAVLIEFLAKLERDVQQGSKHWTEVSAAQDLKNMRLAAPLNRGLSFGSISASGPNGAIIHYRPANDTDRDITTSDMYLLDSGGQYLDGTTDVTRTMHYGNPSAYEIECYTRVLMGAIDLASMVWPEGLYGREIDMSARAPLWEVGLEYRHGTGHGIGSYLSVHEGPGRISLAHSTNPSEETLHAYMYFSDGPGFIALSKRSFYKQEELLAHMYFSDEPGFYEPDSFGIRLETVVMVEPTNTTYKFGDKQFLRFKPITLVPFEPNLINYDLLSTRQVRWLNNYHKLTQDTMEPLLTTELAKAWLRTRTRPYEVPTNANSASAVRSSVLVVVATVVMAAASVTLTSPLL